MYYFLKIKESLNLGGGGGALNEPKANGSRVLRVLVVGEALLFGRAKRAAGERPSERRATDPPLSRLLSRVYFSRYPQNG